MKRSHVSHLVRHVGESTLGQDGLSDHSAEGHHSETSVRDFLQLHVSFLFRAGTFKETHGVKSKLARLATRSLEHLHDGNGAKDFGDADPEEKLSHGALFDQSIVGGDGGETFVGIRGGEDSESHVHGGKAHHGQHAHASVLQFGLTEKVNGDKVGEAEGVETDISNVSFAVRRSFQEGKGLAGNIRSRGVLGFGGSFLEKLRGSTACLDAKKRVR